MATEKSAEKKADKAPSAAKTIEQDLDDLEKIVAHLEKDTMGLEESINLFEKGVALSESAKKRLEEAETRVDILMKRGGKVEAEPFGK